MSTSRAPPCSIARVRFAIARSTLCRSSRSGIEGSAPRHVHSTIRSITIGLNASSITISRMSAFVFSIGSRARFVHVPFLRAREQT